MNHRLTTLASLALLAASCKPGQEIKVDPQIPVEEILVEDTPIPETFAGQREYVNCYFQHKKMYKAIMPFNQRMILVYVRDTDIDSIPDYEMWISYKNESSFPFGREPELIIIDNSRKKGIGSVDLIGYSASNPDFTITSYIIKDPTEIQRRGADQVYSTIINLLANAIHDKTMSLYNYGYKNNLRIDQKGFDDAIENSRSR